MTAANTAICTVLGGASSECHLVLSASGKVTGQAPDFLVPVFAIKDKIPVVVLDVAIKADVRLKLIVFLF